PYVFGNRTPVVWRATLGLDMPSGSRHQHAHYARPCGSLGRLSGVMLARKIEIVLPRSHPDEQPNSLFSNSSLVGTCRFSMMDVITLRSRLKVSRMSWDLKLGCPCAAEERLS